MQSLQTYVRGNALTLTTSTNGAHSSTTTSPSNPCVRPHRHPPPASPPSPARALTPPSTALLTPINLLLVSLLLFTAYLRWRPRAPAKLPPAPPPTVFRTFTPPTLQPLNGLDGAPVYLAVRGRVFDVSPGRNFYGPGGPYENFAGRDASRGLACGSFDEDMLTKDLHGPLDKLEGLGPDEMEALRNWEERFLEKYLVVGKLVAVGEEGAGAGEKK